MKTHNCKIKFKMITEINLSLEKRIILLNKEFKIKRMLMINRYNN